MMSIQPYHLNARKPAANANHVPHRCSEEARYNVTFQTCCSFACFWTVITNQKTHLIAWFHFSIENDELLLTTGTYHGWCVCM